MNMENIDIKAVLQGDVPLSKTDQRLVLDRVFQLERDIASTQRAALAAERLLDDLRTLIGDDRHAFTFQSLGQYRGAIKQFIARGQK
ncbi:hypothetical protein [Janthinobacterium sp.]|uniref:hypothetical protein n=1 Tax=Janthinobacterium sp. TaxID=1871054 RepID=UPI00293D5E98|nr:hypothetical protein [Janthinobacterium sp.]